METSSRILKAFFLKELCQDVKSMMTRFEKILFFSQQNDLQSQIWTLPVFPKKKKKNEAAFIYHLLQFVSKKERFKFLTKFFSHMV